jgi:putative integral membrane protein (TIGR02587 family)
MEWLSHSPRAMTDETRKIAVGYARGAMGGLLVGVPAFLTMEIWWGGFNIPATRLLLLFAANFGVLLILQHYSGTTHQTAFAAEARAALVTLGIGIVTSFIALYAIGVLHGEFHARELVGKLLLQAVPVSIGASVAMSEFGEDHDVIEERRKNAGYWDSLGMAIGGAMLFGFAISGTEEPLLIADQLSWIRALLLIALSLLQVHAIVYAVDFKQRPEDVGTARHTAEVLREGISTYAVSILVGAYLLWTFGTLDSRVGLTHLTYLVIATGFVTSLGAAAAELLI